MARAPLPMMNYQLEVGDQFYKPSPLVQNMPTNAPSTSVAPIPQPQLRQRPMRSFEEVCQIIDDMEQQGLYTPARQLLYDQRLAQAGYPPSSQCAHKSSSPFESEVVQYALIFVIAYVVIKKL